METVGLLVVASLQPSRSLSGGGGGLRVYAVPYTNDVVTAVVRHTASLV